MREGADLPYGRLGIFHKKAIFALFFCHIDFQKNIHFYILFCSLLLNLSGKAQGIHRMDQDGLSQNLMNLVALQMSDHMPAHIIRKAAIFCLDLLNLIFTKIPGSSLISFLKHGNRFCLAYRNKRYLGRISSRSLAGLLDTPSYYFQIVSYL